MSTIGRKEKNIPPLRLGFFASIHRVTRDPIRLEHQLLCTFLHATVFGEILSRLWLEQQRPRSCNTGIDETSAASPLYRSPCLAGEKKNIPQILSPNLKCPNIILYCSPKHGHVTCCVAACARKRHKKFLSRAKNLEHWESYGWQANDPLEAGRL